MRRLLILLVIVIIAGGLYLSHIGALDLGGLLNTAQVLSSQASHPGVLKIIDISTSPTPNSKTDRLLVRWHEGYSGETSYSVEKSFDNKTWKELKKLSFDQAFVYPANAVTSPTIGQLITRETVDPGPFAPDQVAYYRVKAYKNATLLWTTDVGSGWVSKSHPGKPINVSASMVNSSLVLSWTDQNERVLRFDIERMYNGGTWAALTSVDFNQANHGSYSYTDTTATPGYAYVYRLRSVNSRGPSNYAESNQVSYVDHRAPASDAPIQIPAPVTNPTPTQHQQPAGPTLTVKYSRGILGLGERRVKLNWTANSNLNEYTVYIFMAPTNEISSADNAYKISHFSEPNVTTYVGAYSYDHKVIHGNPEYIMGGLQSGYTYYFKVRAQVTPIIHTDMSNVVVVKVP